MTLRSTNVTARQWPEITGLSEPDAVFKGNSGAEVPRCTVIRRVMTSGVLLLLDLFLVNENITTRVRQQSKMAESGG